MSANNFREGSGFLIEVLSTFLSALLLPACNKDVGLAMSSCLMTRTMRLRAAVQIKRSLGH